MSFEDDNAPGKRQHSTFKKRLAFYRAIRRQAGPLDDPQGAPLNSCPSPFPAVRGLLRDVPSEAADRGNQARRYDRGLSGGPPLVFAAREAAMCVDPLGRDVVFQHRECLVPTVISARALLTDRHASIKLSPAAENRQDRTRPPTTAPRRTSHSACLAVSRNRNQCSGSP